ncbi:MAG: DUF4185 domain-containing protein, partial [Desulfobacterales bacterium]|nr:DUF4185 domain-containing protein [Desulfobacterales bacterium]
ADGAYSIELPDNKVLWLYGDTWVGKIHNNKHVDAVLINNSIAIQNNKNPVDASINFFFSQTSEGNPDAFIKPADGKGWFWIYHGLMAEKGLYLFLIQIDRTGSISEPGFKIIGTWLGHVLNPNHHPDQWRITQQRIPWERITDSGDMLFGSSLLLDNGHIYIYGTSEDIIHNVHHKYMILARVPAGSLDKFDKWRFFSNGKWVDDFSLASRICSDMANEYSVSYLPVFDKYITVYTEKSVSENIMIRFAPEPYGPWSEPVSIFKCPEVKWDDNIFCYAAKAHPALTSAPDELIITYVANSSDFWKMAADARLYRPKFLRAKFSNTRILPFPK